MADEYAPIGRVPRRSPSPARYVVLNPRGIPAGSYIVRVGDRRWYEGDTYDGPVDHVANLVERGFLREEG